MYDTILGLNHTKKRRKMHVFCTYFDLFQSTDCSLVSYIVCDSSMLEHSADKSRPTKDLSVIYCRQSEDLSVTYCRQSEDLSVTYCRQSEDLSVRYYRQSEDLTHTGKVRT